ncbi:MAG TPA: hypothetical protein VFU46_01895 [Gemmatimonadales bacterium]|nr:hypothetical protein [Gemmatimonadales bacterium]
MLFRFGPAFRAGGWILTAAGFWYVLLAVRNLRDGMPVSWPLLVLGVAAIVVGTALLRWIRRAGP